METWYYFRTDSPAGQLFLAASATGLVRLEFDIRMQLKAKTISLQESKDALAPYLRELEEYFSGKRRVFSVPLDLRGTEFQLQCWHTLLDIPYGETATYGGMAMAATVWKWTNSG